VIEYEIKPVSTACQVDLQTKHKTITNALGLAAFEDPSEMQKLCVHADGTKVSRTKKTDGYDVSVSKEPLAHVKCEVQTSGDEVGVRVYVECADGATLEIVPQTLARGSLQPLSPDEPEFSSLAGHARICLKTCEGAAVISKGRGQVRVLSGSDAEAFAQGDALEDTAEQCYVAHCDVDCLCLRDVTGGEYQLNGDQTLHTISLAQGVTTSGGLDELHSPRCLVSQQSSIAKGTESLEVTNTAPHPRLLLVYGDGRAEELMAKGD